MAFLFAKGIALRQAQGTHLKILFVRSEQKDCNVKPDPQGFAQIKINHKKSLRFFSKAFGIKII